MDRHLLDYLPPVLREVLEFQAINEACEPEIALAWSAAEKLLEDQFLDTASETGVRIWEQELGIRPKDTDTLDGRKARVKAMWNTELPYTIRWLSAWLTDVYGPDSHQETVADYTISIILNYDLLPGAFGLPDEIKRILEDIKPANMLLHIEVASTEIATEYAYAVCTGSEIEDGAVAVRY